MNGTSQRPAWNDAMGWLDHLHDALGGTLGPDAKVQADEAMEDVFAGRLSGKWHDWRDRFVERCGP